MGEPWSDDEIVQTIEIHLQFRGRRPGRDAAIRALATQLGREESTVRAAVDAVDAVDPLDPRTVPPPTRRLRELWAERVDEAGLPYVVS